MEPDRENITHLVGVGVVDLVRYHAEKSPVEDRLQGLPLGYTLEHLDWQKDYFENEARNP